jgi:4-carboxymuconolactone decarboxylase
MRNPSSSKAKIRPVAPKLFELIEGTVYGDLWQRPQLSRRDRSLITVAALIGMRQTDQLRSHLEKALGHGISAEEIGEMITHVAVYAGFPAAISAALVAKPLLAERGLIADEDPPAQADTQAR